MRKSATEAAESYRNIGENDSEYEYDDGVPIIVHSTQHELDYAEFEIIVASESIHEAFIHAIFHYWERWARSLTNSGTRDCFDVLKKNMSQAGFQIDGRLEGLNSLNNWLKHNNPARAINLFEQWNDIVVVVNSDQEGKEPIYLVRVTRDTVNQAFDIIKNSGPQTRRKETAS